MKNATWNTDVQLVKSSQWAQLLSRNICSLLMLFSSVRIMPSSHYRWSCFFWHHKHATYNRSRSRTCSVQVTWLLRRHWARSWRAFWRLSCNKEVSASGKHLNKEALNFTELASKSESAACWTSLYVCPTMLTESSNLINTCEWSDKKDVVQICLNGVQTKPACMLTGSCSAMGPGLQSGWVFPWGPYFVHLIFLSCQRGCCARCKACRHLSFCERSTWRLWSPLKFRCHAENPTRPSVCKECQRMPPAWMCQALVPWGAGQLWTCWWCLSGSCSRHGLASHLESRVLPRMVSWCGSFWFRTRISCTFRCDTCDLCRFINRTWLYRKNQRDHCLNLALDEAITHVQRAICIRRSIVQCKAAIRIGHFLVGKVGRQAACNTLSLSVRVTQS